MATDSFILAGVMGWPISHSRSPLIHSHWITAYGLKGAYVPLAVNPVNLQEALVGLKALGFAGCNLTLPHKVQALECITQLDDVARQIGAVNTVIVQPDGSLRGTNTDAFGYIQSLREAQPTWQASTGPAVVLGAGGAARAVVWRGLEEPLVGAVGERDEPAALHAVVSAAGMAWHLLRRYSV